LDFNPVGHVVEELHDVITDKHVLSTGDELAICPARVIGETLFAIGPVRNQNHHPSALFDENRMFDQTRHGADVFMHLRNDLTGEIVRGCSPIIILVTGIEAPF
jgi:hypothetical protein